MIGLKSGFLWVVDLIILMLALIIRIWRRINFIIFALFAFAFIRAWNISLIALAVSFLAPWVFAVAAFRVHILLVNFIIKCVDIPFKNLLNRISSFLLVLMVVEACSIVSALAVLSAKSIVSQAFAVEFQALTFAFTTLALGHGCLSVFNFAEQLFLVYSF